MAQATVSTSTRSTILPAVAANTVPNDEIVSSLPDIQGNILGGFNKDYQSLLFLHFSDAIRARRWLGSIACEVASSHEVLDFNNLFKAMKQRRGGELGLLKVTWMNIAFSFSGLAALNLPDLSAFPDDFKAGMADRAALIGDTGDSAPENWVGSLGSKRIHAVLIVASDTQEDLHTQVARYVQNFTAIGGVELVFLQEGAVRADQPGHEHFGFKDGVSQPGLRGVDTSKGTNPDQGNPGQDLLWPGEFVLGHPTQQHGPLDGHDGPNPIAGGNSTSGPVWTRNGSYLVFRRLAQDVKGFHDHVHALTHNPHLNPAHLSEDVIGAKLVGRYASGAPLEPLSTNPVGNPNHADPATIDPTLPDDDLRNNNFEYGSDADGQHVPLAAHIRKAYPRDEKLPGVTAEGSESETQTHRLLRRGIPFGTSFRPTLGATSHGVHNALMPNDRGLLFLCYQHSLRDQFEFVQQTWVNNPDFPRSGAGADPIITPRDSAGAAGGFEMPQCPHMKTIRHFVTTTGGEYFFQPSLSTLTDVIAS